MKKSNVIAALAALAQDNRLDVYRLLVEAGPDGLPAGQVAAALKLAPNTLTFHFDRLRGAGLVSVTLARRALRTSMLSRVQSPFLKLPLRAPRGPPEPFA